MRRFKHSLSHYRLLTGDLGLLMPIGCYEVLPGDTIQQSTSLLVRSSPLLAPVMHPVHVRVHHWFVPYRLLWTQWEDFITGGSDGLGDGATFPTIALVAPAVGSLADYLGVPTGSNVTVNALPFRAYQAVFNEAYRDQDLVTEAALVKTGGADATTSQALQSIAWEKDRMTTARPWAQRGTAVSLPLGTVAPVVSDGTAPTFVSSGGTAGNARGLRWNVGTTNIEWATSAGAASAPDAGTTEEARFTTSGLQANLTGATASTITDLRRAMALQAYQEARAQYGARYTEYLRYLQVPSADSRLQRPEYCGGGRQTISFSEVLQTSVNSADNNGVGTLRGHGIAAMRSNRFRRYIPEHGLILSLLSIRPKAMYINGLHKMWGKTTKEEFWQRELEHIGQEQVLNKEVRVNHATPNGTFGWNDRYSDYRHLPSHISGDFRSTLNQWHFARAFGADPSLNSAFVTCTPPTAPFASAAADTLWIMANHSIQARRMVSSGGQPGRIV